MALSSAEGISYALDTLKAATTGTIITKSGNGIDLSGVSSVTGFQIDASIPAGTDIRILFNTEGSNDWFKIASNGTAQNVTVNTPGYDQIKAGGNTVTELRELTTIPAIAGKKLRIAIGMDSIDIKNVVPKIRLSIKAQSTSQELVRTETSPLYELGADAQIGTITSESEISGSGTLKVYAQTTDSAGKTSDWTDIKNVSGVKCAKVRLKAEYAVSEVGGGNVKLKESQISYTETQNAVTGSASGEIISLTQDWYMNVRHCRMKVRHSELINSEIYAYVCFREAPKRELNEQLGIGTGEKKTYQLKHAENVKYDSVRLYYDNVLVQGSYDLNTAVGRLTCKAPDGVIITCSYEYGWGQEFWHRMDLTSRMAFDSYEESEYRYTRPDESENMTVCAVKLALMTNTGSITKESIGKGTGKARTYKLLHAVKDGNITIYDNGAAMSKKKYMLKDDTQYVSIAATSGHELTASYKWVSERVDVYQFAAVFSE